VKGHGILAFVLTVASAFAQRHWDDRNWRYEDRETIRRSFDVGSAARKLLVDNVSGFIHVTGGTGSQVQVTVEKQIRAWSNEAAAEAKRDVKLDLSQQGGFVRLYVDGPFRGSNGINYRGDDYYGYRVIFDYEIQVPQNTELVLKTINYGDIAVKNTTGDFEIRGLNGGIHMQDVSGSGLVKTLNGPVNVSFTKNPERETRFHTLNGRLDVYFQPGLNADLHFKTLNGGVYSDFDVTPQPSASSGDTSGGRWIFRADRSGSGRVGNGGLPLCFETLNGRILIHAKPL